ncbi:amidohydrolase [Winogradskyella sp. J14-2]|uniref:amidohydrolase n=1 Tax=Winogradskyella sp. J14-2 TaxID=1936080 RepID=UPI000972A900|nr:amidohydrolase [Winogradskyella sp. J14-2]APY07818.1 amidohydrolase [Winogradskyella sp. J14-2]
MKKNVVLIVIAIFTQSMLLTAQINSEVISEAVEKNNEKFVKIFKEIHQNPELGFSEVKTAAIVAKELKSYGYKVTEGIAKTGVAGVMKNGEGPIVMYRADMDANAVKELTDLPYKSTVIAKKEDGSETPVAHACGHDSHTTWLMSTAKFMAEHKTMWKGTIIFIAQPAEELILGAQAMVKDGLYTKHGIPKPDYLFGIHAMPFPVGVVAAASGIRMAGTDQLDVTFYGVGGHGSNPQLTKDPILMAASAIMQYQAIVSRAIDPKNSAVLTVGAIEAGKDNNVIPEEALLKINLRWFSEKDRNLMIEGIKRINKSIAVAYGLPEDKMPTMTMKGWSYPLENEPKLTETVREALYPLVKDKKMVLDETVLPSVMGSEDLHHLVIENEKNDCVFINVGVAEPKRFEEAMKKGTLPFANHNGNFEIDLAAIPYGSKVAVTAVLTIFNKN